MKRILIALALLLSLSLAAQTDWKKIDNLLEESSFKSAYSESEKVFKKSQNSRELLTAAWYMTRAASEYQEDFVDSAEARYRALLPRLDAVDRAVCYAFLGKGDSALMEEDLLKRTPSEGLERFCEGEKKGINLTPTAYDVVAQTVIERVGGVDVLALQQKLVEFHQDDSDDIRIAQDLDLIEMMVAMNPNGERREQLLRDYIDKYHTSSCPRVATLYYQLASELYEKDRMVEAEVWCDSAMVRFPKSEGGAYAANLKARIRRAVIDISIWNNECTKYPGQPSLHRLEYMNLNRLYFALYSYDGSEFDDFMKRLPNACHQWQVEVADDGSHKRHEFIFDVPGVEAGRYILVVSADDQFDMNDAYMTLQCMDFLVCNTQGGEFMLVDGYSGNPIEGQEIVVLDPDEKPIDTIVTAIDGRFRLYGEKSWYNPLRIKRGGAVFEDNIYQVYRENEKREKQVDGKTFTDRPIYRPGDTVHFAAVLFETDDVDGRVLSNRGATLKFLTPNRKVQERLSLFADTHGVVSATFVIPSDAMAGYWRVELSSGLLRRTCNIRVEEYKQPKFMVSLAPAESQAPVFGSPYRVRGIAQAYSGVNIFGARVKYNIRRYTLWHRWVGGEGSALSFSDSTVTSADGSFEITFTPQPDSSVNFAYNPYFNYQIKAEVTDLNGETHEANLSFNMGFQNERLGLYVDNDLSTVRYSYSDLNGIPLSGDVTLQVMCLHLPDTVRLTPSIMKDNSHAALALGRDEFRHLFPHYTYNASENEPSTWKTEWQYTLHHHADGTQKAYSLELPTKEFRSGVYRIVVSAGGAIDTQYIKFVRPGERTLPTEDLLWADVSDEKVEVGDQITVRYASAFDGTSVFYLLTDPEGREIASQWLSADRRIRSFSIPVDSSMLGGFHVAFVTVRDGVRCDWGCNIEVPFTHKKLNVEIATFRDKLLPGEQEEWTIKVTGDKRSSPNTQRSSLIMTMYDDALNSYSVFPKWWSLYPWRQNYSHNIQWESVRCESGDYYEDIKSWTYKDFDSYSLIFSYGLFDFRRGHRMYKNKELSFNAEVLSTSAEEDGYSGTARGEGGMVTMQGGVRKRTGVKQSEEMIFTVVENDAAVLDNVRNNLSTFGFFVCDLHTDSTGTATYHFRVPELLTRWSIKGLAFSDDLKIGTLDKSLVTSKPLMVQPNIPRFLRHGDSIVLMAKVMNLTDNERKVCVNFSLRNASQDTQNIPNILHNQNTQIVTVPAQGSAQVTFPISDLPKNLYVATYEITAQTCDEKEHRDLPYFSDGERGQIPVVSNRKAVTLSQPVYINGAGEKSFHFSLSDFHSPTAEPHFLGAELVSNPVWLAIKSMPYLKQQENPSTIYLANSLYVNTLAKNIIATIGTIETISDTANTRLKINEDVKQTLLDATPWLRDAESEVEQRQAIANYFDSIRLSEEFAKLNAQLASRQNSDGGWSWMPEGESSTWVTMQVLKRVTKWQSDQVAKSSQALSHSVTRALQYIDREEQRHYEKYIKPYLKKYKWSPDNIDYLYTRSFYDKGNTEAYKFYYNNALKNYKNYNGLYIQAQLALIFQRHGDKQAARDLIRRLKEKALESDEMGMYWRDNRSGWCWYERPIETQALLIQAFREVTPKDTLSIALMQQWLIKQKQTTHWGNDRATVEAISALVTPENPNTPSNPNTLTALKSTTLTLCGVDLSAPSEGLEGYRTQRWEGSALDSIIALDDSTVTLRKVTPGIAWGAVYYQYTDDMDKIPSSESGITLKRCYLNQNNQNILNTPNTLKVGDRVKVRIDISCDRTMEYLELIDGRPSCVEPLSTRAGWNWNQGLRYYVEVKNTATHCYINRLEKGKYVVEYDVYVTNPGIFLAGPVTMQCMYAPEFRAIAPATRLEVEK